jgi:hypothetical protein
MKKVLETAMKKIIKALSNFIDNMAMSFPATHICGFYWPSEHQHLDMIIRKELEKRKEEEKKY